MTEKDQIAVTEYEMVEKKPNTSLVDEHLLRERKVFLVGDVEPDTIGKLTKELLYLDTVSHDPIDLYIDTPGGDVYSILGLYDTIRKHLKARVNIIVLSTAQSAGACIVAICGTGKRIAGPNSTFMLHESSSSTSGKASDIEIDVKETKRLDRRVNKLLIKHTKLTYKDLTEKFLKNVYFTSAEARQWGLIDKIL